MNNTELLTRAATCYRCLHHGLTVTAKKIKGLTAEHSAQFRACAKCGCRTFFQAAQSQHTSEGE